MSRYYEPYLDSLIDNFSPELLGALDIFLLQNSNLEGEDFSMADLLGHPLESVRLLLARLVADGFLDLVTEATCPACGNQVSALEINEGECQSCQADLSESDSVEAKGLYRLRRPRNRDIGWIIAVHGMSSYAPWQEELQWLIDKIFPVTLPFRNFKYGNTRVAPFSPWGQHEKLQRLESRWQSYLLDLPPHLATVRPDVIAHSFGTWLVGHLLLSNPSIQVGNVITVGSILRPDFDWASLIRRGQVQAVLNHYGLRDRWVPLAEHVIPDSGPSGRGGFANPEKLAIYNLSEDIDHSDFFDTQLNVRFNDIWRHFLQGNIEKLGNKMEIHADSTGWAPSSALLRAPSPLGWILGFLKFVRFRLKHR